MELGAEEDVDLSGIDGSYPLPDVPSTVPWSDHALWHVLLRVFARTPTDHELQIWGNKLDKGLTARQFVNQLSNGKRFGETKFVRMKNPPGHFFSPVVDPDQVKEYVEFVRKAGPGDIGGIDLPLDEMEAFWRRNQDFIAKTPFTEEKVSKNRYYYLGGPFPFGDAITARAILHESRPKRVIEIGSGFSSACMLDAADEIGLSPFSMTCIEPYPKRLKSILRESDKHVEIIEKGVQLVPLEIFSSLEPGDILFIDSTHVLKTGSDVHYELFYILPLLKPGVLVHFHDVRFPFEYSDKQIFFKNYSWNEAYGVRALLMYSNRFRVLFSGSLFAAERTELVKNTIEKYLRNPGSSLWVKVIG